jgi:hypothetical protein
VPALLTGGARATSKMATIASGGRDGGRFFFEDSDGCVKEKGRLAPCFVGRILCCGASLASAKPSLDERAERGPSSWLESVSRQPISKPWTLTNPTPSRKIRFMIERARPPKSGHTTLKAKESVGPCLACKGRSTSPFQSKKFARGFCRNCRNSATISSTTSCEEPISAKKRVPCYQSASTAGTRFFKSGGESDFLAAIS